MNGAHPEGVLAPCEGPEFWRAAAPLWKLEGGVRCGMDKLNNLKRKTPIPSVNITV